MMDKYVIYNSDLDSFLSRDFEWDRTYDWWSVYLLSPRVMDHMAWDIASDVDLDTFDRLAIRRVLKFIEEYAEKEKIMIMEYSPRLSYVSRSFDEGESEYFPDFRVVYPFLVGDM